MSEGHAICVYCGAQNAVASHYLDAGKQFGKMLAENDVTLVYGGGNSGMMGAVANSTLQNKGKVIGVFPRELKGLEDEHRGLTEIHLVDGMHQRKQLMFDNSNGFVALPGGFGTLDELFEMITWRQLKFHDKPILLYNHRGYWDHWVALAENMLREGFALPYTRDCFQVVDKLEDIIPTILDYNARETGKKPPF